MHFIFIFEARGDFNDFVFVMAIFYELFIYLFIFFSDLKYNDYPGSELEADVEYFSNPRLVVYCLVS